MSIHSRNEGPQRLEAVMEDQALVDSLIAIAGPAAVSTDEAARQFVAGDLFLTGYPPRIVVRPSSSDAVVACIAACVSNGYAVFPRGGGLSYTGGYIAQTERAVTFDLRNLNKIIEIADEDMTLTVETGVTWKQIYEALAPKGLRLPFFGTFSGIGATVGGGLGHGALFFGSARYGPAAEMVLGLEVALANGSLMRTGQGALREASKSVYRNSGPDLTGLFVHDGGAFGVKTQATLRLIREPIATDFASFAFQSFDEATSALCEIARADLVEEVYILDPASTDDLKVSPAEARRAMTSIARHAGGPLRAATALYAAARHGTRLIPRGHYSLHLVAAGRSHAAVQADIRAARKIATRRNGKPVASTIPRLARAQLFENLDGILGSDGRRWAALNAKVAHSDALDLVRSAENAIAPFKNDMTALGVSPTKLASALSNHCYSYEVVYHWKDALSPIHRAAIKPDVLEKYAHTAPNPEAWQLVKELRSETVKIFQKKGAASNQLGRTYPFMTALTVPPADFLRQIKRYLDPHGLMNPGVLELN